jgi:hypothetical protein
MNHDNQFEHRASSSRSMHVGESSYALCDRPSRTRDFSQRQLPTDQDYAVSTREYQTDQSSLKSAPTAARPVLGKRPMQRQRQKQPHSCAGVDRVTPYQGRISKRSAAGADPRFRTHAMWSAGCNSCVRKIAASRPPGHDSFTSIETNFRPVNKRYVPGCLVVPTMRAQTKAQPQTKIRPPNVGSARVSSNARSLREQSCWRLKISAQHGQHRMGQHGQVMCRYQPCQWRTS